MGRDITERKLAEDETKLFLDILTHDLKNFHQAAKGFLDLAMMEEELDKDRRLDFLTIARANMLRSINLTNDISVFMKQKLSHQYNLQPINLTKCLEEVTQTLVEIFPREDIIIDNQITKDIFIKADSLFEQLILNLLTNAVKNDLKEIINITINGESSGNTFQLFIIDQGSGISPEKRENIFDQYKVFRENGKGSGLGLFIVKTLIERYEGSIKIENRDPQDYQLGTKFVIELKLATSESN